jgi:succinate dehydrogenase cytochrome b subunit
MNAPIPLVRARIGRGEWSKNRAAASLPRVTEALSRMAKAITLYDTTIGKKAAMAVTGIVLYGFVIAHMLGNLQVFMGPEQYNGYAKKLHDLGPLLWVFRLVLLTAFVTHVVAILQLIARGMHTRPVGYRMKKNQTTSYAALTMKYGGFALLFFVLFHLAHFTVPGVAMSHAYHHDPTDVYANFVNGFKVPWVTAIYVLAQIFLGLHLYHGSWSLFQTLGFNHPKYNARRQLIAQSIGVAVAAGNIAMPVAVLAGFVQ